MFKFSTTHVINDIEDVKALKFTSGTGLQKITLVDGTATAGTAVVTNGFKKVPTHNELIVGRNNIFDSRTVTSIKMNEAKAGTEASATVTFNAALEATKIYRLYVYVSNPVGADPLMANANKDKGKPFYIEFKDTADTKTTSTAATALEKAITSADGKFTLTYDDGPVFTAVASGNVVTLTITSKQNKTLYDFKNIEVQVLTDYYNQAGQPAANYPYSDTQFVKADIAAVAYNHLVPAFGSYDYILNNLRLPTNANTQFFGDQWDEMPVKDATYDQYIITVCTERPEIQGGVAVGQYNVSKTTHILWVNDTYHSDFLKLINATIKPTSADIVPDTAVGANTINESDTDKVHSTAASKKANA